MLHKASDMAGSLITRDHNDPGSENVGWIHVAYGEGDLLGMVMGPRNINRRGISCS